MKKHCCYFNKKLNKKIFPKLYLMKKTGNFQFSLIFLKKYFWEFII